MHVQQYSRINTNTSLYNVIMYIGTYIHVYSGNGSYK